VLNTKLQPNKPAAELLCGFVMKGRKEVFHPIVTNLPICDFLTGTTKKFADLLIFSRILYLRTGTPKSFADLR
jgi:hypothetical protein